MTRTEMTALAALMATVAGAGTALADGRGPHGMMGGERLDFAARRGELERRRLPDGGGQGFVDEIVEGAQLQLPEHLAHLVRIGADVAGSEFVVQHHPKLFR